MLKSSAIIIAVAALAALISAFIHPNRPAWYSVEDTSGIRWSLSVEQAEKLSDNAGDILWIDARSRSDYENRHVSNAILLNTVEWGDLMFKHQNTLQDAMGKPVVVYCDGSSCEKSAVIATRLRELLGLDPVYVLKGDWKKISVRETR